MHMHTRSLAQDLAVVFPNASSLAMSSVYGVEKLALQQSVPLTFAMIAALFPAAQADPESANLAHYPWQSGCLNTASGCCRCCKGVHTAAVPQPQVAAVPVAAAPPVAVLPPVAALPKSAPVPAVVPPAPVKILLAHQPTPVVAYKEQPKNRRDLGYLMNLFLDTKEGKLHPY